MLSTVVLSNENQTCRGWEAPTSIGGGGCHGLWEKTLNVVSKENSDEIVQSYLEESTMPSPLAYLFDHPVYLIILIGGVLLIFFLIVLYVQSDKNKRRQEKIASETATERIMTSQSLQ